MIKINLTVPSGQDVDVSVDNAREAIEVIRGIYRSSSTVQATKTEDVAPTTKKVRRGKRAGVPTPTWTNEEFAMVRKSVLEVGNPERKGSLEDATALALINLRGVSKHPRSPLSVGGRVAEFRKAIFSKGKHSQNVSRPVRKYLNTKNGKVESLSIATPAVSGVSPHRTGYLGGLMSAQEA